MMRSLRTYISILKSVKNRPTKYFLYLVAMIVALFMQAYMHNYNIVYIMMFFLVGVAGAASMYGVLNLSYLQVALLSHERFFASTVGSYKLSLLNTSEHDAYDITISSQESTQYIRSIKLHSSQVLTFKTLFEKRGTASLPSFTLSSLFPLSFELKYKELHLDNPLFVYAKPEGVSLFSIYNKNNSLNGEMNEFDGIREFQEGESLSYIHWASLAKDEKLKSKTFLYEEEQKTLHFKFDSLSGEVEQRLKQLTLWVLECEKHNLAFTLEINTILLDSKEQSIDEILTSIASY